MNREIPGLRRTLAAVARRFAPAEPGARRPAREIAIEARRRLREEASGHPSARTPGGAAWR
jgi:hypothetical protein